jgi:hypothetical protein
MSSRVAQRLGLPEVDPEIRRKALLEPGPTWREWFVTDFLKVWIALSFLIIDTFIAATWLKPFNPGLLLITLGTAFYLEFLAYRVLWYDPAPIGRSIRQTFKPDWLHPVPYGRWSPPGERARKGLPAFPDQPEDLDPQEFL